jgi:hypothetical protein
MVLAMTSAQKARSRALAMRPHAEALARLHCGNGEANEQERGYDTVARLEKVRAEAADSRENHT